MRTRHVSGAIALSLTLATVAATAPATADPKPVPVPGKAATYRTYVAVGSDTIQDVWNGLTNGYKTTKAVTPTVASYDAFPLGSKIRTRNGGPVFTRPSGSGAGVKALTASVKGTAFNGVKIANQVDFARSSSGPAAGTGLTYMPFARDAVTVAIKTSAKGYVSLKTADLVAIYTCKKTTVMTSAKATIKVKPKLPQASSGTLKFFLGALGNPAVGKCVAQTTLPENNGSALKLEGELIPFSAAQWIAQKNGVTANTTMAGQQLAIINGATPVAVSGKKLVPGSLYGALTRPPASGAGVFARDTYNVIPTAKRKTPLEATLIKASWASAVLKDFGFGPLSYAGNAAMYKVGGFQS